MVVLYEDELTDGKAGRQSLNFFPLTHLRAVFELRCGVFSPLERILRFYKREKIALFVRPELKDLIEERTGLRVFSINQPMPKDKRFLFISGRSILLEKIPEEGEDQVFLSEEGDLLGFRLNLNGKGEVKTQIVKSEGKRVKGFLLKDLWDLITLNEKVLPFDLKKGGMEGDLDKNVLIIGPKSRLFLGKEARVFAGSVLNLEGGNIYIDEKAEIKPLSYLEGPVYIGKRTIINQGKIRPFSNIGENCRIGGEVEATIFQGNSNKYHEGFLGHSYVGEWVNIGAGTNNSDLKNNYSTVKIKLGKELIDTGLMKLGCFIGDYAKIGIGTKIPTGGIIGVFANVVGDGFIPRHIPNFYWSKGKRWEIEKALKSAGVMMARRGKTLTERETALIKRVYLIKRGV